MVDNIPTCRFDGKTVLTAVVDEPGLGHGAVGLGLIQSEDGTDGSVTFSNVEARSL